MENINHDHVKDTISHNVTYTENEIAIKEQLSSSYSVGSNYTYLWIIGTMDDKNQTYKGFRAIPIRVTSSCSDGAVAK